MALCSVLADLAYFCMDTALGGYVCTVNLVDAHTRMLVLLGQPTLLQAPLGLKCLYEVVTALPRCVPVVGTTLLRSRKQLGLMIVFLGMPFVMG